MDNVSLGLQLKAIRVLYGIRQSELATATGIKQPYLSQFESGRFNLTDEEISKIKSYLQTVGVQSPIVIHLSNKLTLAA